MVSHDLVVENLTKSFPGRGEILKNISLKVPQGQAVAIVGGNGCGKSTLLRCCLRLVEPDSGKISLLEEDVRSLSRKKLRRLRAKVGFVFQKHNLVGRLSVLSNVIHGGLGKQNSPLLWRQYAAPGAIRLEAMNCLERVGLAHLAESPACQLSGGESQRVAIARALMQRPKVVIADEPTASLDPKIGEEVMGLLFDLTRRDGLTLMHVSHNLEQSCSYSDRIIGLKNHMIKLDAATKTVCQKDLEQIYA